MQPTATERERFWRDHLMACRQSGQTLKAYAEAQGLAVAQLYKWNRRLKGRGALVPVQVVGLPRNPDAERCRVVLASGLTLEWPIDAEPARLRGLIDALEHRR